MTCKLLKDIKHRCEYNAGGIAEIVVLDINDFVSYTFTDDRLYDSCLVEEINTKSDSVLVSLDVVSESSFTEQEANSIYTQTLSTFVRSLGHENLERLLRAKGSRLLVMFRTHQDVWFTFGSDCGAALTFEQISGQLGESSGYKITIKANSIYPLFEANVDFSVPLTVPALGTEDNRVVMSEDESFAFQIYN